MRKRIQIKVDDRKVHGTPWGKYRLPNISKLEKDPLFDELVSLGKRYNFDYPHSSQVCRLSLALFDEIKKVHCLKKKDRHLLMVASLLHDVGAHRLGGKSPVKPQKMPISTQGHEHPHHHKRSQRIIIDEGITGLNGRELKIVSCVARYHTKALPHKSHLIYCDLDKACHRRIRRMAALLRIADSLDRRHASMVQDLRCLFIRKERILILWLFCKKHAFDWRPKHRTDLFTKEFSLKIKIQVLFGTLVG